MAIFEKSLFYKEYPQLISGIHRKIPTPVGAPALVCWLVFWRPLTLDPKNEKTPEELRKNRDINLNAYLTSLGEHFDKISGTKTSIRMDYRNSNDYQLIVYAFNMREINIKIRFEMHTEYVSVSIYLDLSSKPHPIKELEEPINTNTKDVIDNITKHFDVLKGLFSNNLENDDYDKTHQYLYEDVWEKFIFLDIIKIANLRENSTTISISQTIFNSMMSPNSMTLNESTTITESTILSNSSPHDNNNPPPLSEVLGKIISSGRWVVLGSPEEIEDKDDTKSFFGQPFKKERKNGDHLIYHNPSAIEPDKARKIVGSLWPFFLSARGLNKLKDFEFTISRLLGAQAIYISALGPLPELCENMHPIFSFLYSNTLNRWEIGRLIEHLNHLGTVRIVATMNVAELRRTGDHLRLIEKLIREAEEAVNTFAHANTTAPNYTTNFSNQGTTNFDFIQRKFADIQNAISKINSWFKESDAETFGGVRSRIERSRYYAKQWRDGISALRIRRYEGFPPYNEFVERRLGATFDYIDRLGHRYDGVNKEISQLYHHFLACNALKLTTVIAEQTVEVTNLQTELTHLQKTAEIGFFFVLMPYYLGSVLENISPTIFENHKNGIWWLSLKNAIWLFSIFISTALGLLVITRKHGND